MDAEISALSVPELKRYRLEGTGEQIPLLEEVLDLFQGGPPLLVELKADYFDVSELVEKTVKLLDQYRVNYMHRVLPSLGMPCCGWHATGPTCAGASCRRISGAAGES